MNTKQRAAILYAILAAALYAVNSPASKLLLTHVPAAMMAAFLYLGAGAGLALVRFVQRKTGTKANEKPLTRKELPFTGAMVALDIIAPILLMAGLNLTTAANVSLLNNFEIVATSMIAMFIFKEAVSRRLWFAIGLVTLSSFLLSVDDLERFSISWGAVLVLLACLCWGFENNCTRMLSGKDPLQIVIIKGLGSGIGSLAVAFFIGERVPGAPYMLLTLLLGFVAYGLSIVLYIYAQRELGAARTSTYYAIAPFIGTALSLVIFREVPSVSFIIALFVMMAGAYFASTQPRNKRGS